MATTVTLIGIVLPSLLVAIALRRWIADVPWRIVVLFLCLTLAFLHGAVFSSKLPVPVDEVARGYPWRGLFGEVHPRNALTNDTVKLFLPWMQAVRSDFAHFRAPLWNRYSFSGYPLLGNGESAPFSPLLLATLFVPLPKQIVAMAGLKLFLSLLFTYLLLRRERVPQSGAILAAIGFAFCTFETVVLYYSTTAVTALLPATIFALFLVADEPRRSSVVFVALLVATLLANGHPESVFHIAIASVALLLIEFRIRRLVWPAVGALLGAALSAPAWIPVLEQIVHGTRFAAVRQMRNLQPFPYRAAWALANPDFFGNPVRHDWSWLFNYTAIASSYCGLIPIALVTAAVVSRRVSRREAAWLIVALMSFLIAMRWAIVGELLNRIPPFSIVANDKLRFVTVFLICVSAARFIGTPRRWIVACAIPLIVVALVGRNFVGAATLSLLCVLPSSFAPILLAVELFTFNAGFNVLVHRKYFRPDLPIVNALRRNAPNEPFRVVGRDWVFLSNASAQYGLEDIRGSDPMEFATYASWFRRISVQDPATDLKRVVDINRPELDFLNVRFLLAEPDADFSGKWKLLYRGVDGTLFENTNAQRRFFAAGNADLSMIENEDPAVFHFIVHALSRSAILSSQPFGPGWHVYVNGRSVPVGVIDGAFLSFEVPAGESDVEVGYRPLSYYGSLLISFAALVSLVTLRGPPQ